MPEIRYYTVTQEREVKVWANSPVDAARIADATFSGLMSTGQGLPLSEKVPGEVTSSIRDRDLVVREDY